jgi:hypothetical protein
VSDELAYTLEIERFQSKVAGSDALNDVALRVLRASSGAKRARGSSYIVMPIR